MSAPQPSSRRPPRPLLRFVVALVWSVMVWVALWGRLSVANVVGGLVIGAVILRAAPVSTPSHRMPFRIRATLRFATYFLWSLVKASAVVAWEIVTSGSRITEGIVAIRLRTSSPGLMTLIANTISVTPGTLTLETRLRPPTLYVHVLHLTSRERLRVEIQHLENLVLAAFGPDESPDRREATTCSTPACSGQGGDPATAFEGDRGPAGE